MRITENNSVTVTVTAFIILILSIGAIQFGLASLTATIFGATSPLGEIGTLIYAGVFINGAIATTLAILVIKKAVTHYL